MTATKKEIEEWAAYLIWCDLCNDAAEEQYREEQESPQINNDCIHFNEARNECGIFSISCESMSREVKECYMSIAERDLIFSEQIK